MKHGSKPQKARQRRGPKSFPIINMDAAGIDIGSGEHYVAVPEDRDEQPVRQFGCFTADLEAMANWLEQCRIDTVVMESTGVYWIPCFQILEKSSFLKDNAEFGARFPARLK